MLVVGAEKKNALNFSQWAALPDGNFRHAFVFKLHCISL